MSDNVRHRASEQWKLANQILYNKVHNYVLKARLNTEISIRSKTDLPPINDREAWITYLKNHKPLLTCMVSIDQKNVKHILSLVHSEMVYKSQNDDNNSTHGFINLRGKDRWLGYWLFAVLHCLEMPYSAHILATLRDISRMCLKLKNLLPKEDSRIACYYNMFIYFVAKYFKQTDLMDYV